MASHDFCPGCPKCDRESFNNSLSRRIEKIALAIKEVEKLQQKKITELAQQTLAATIIMFQQEIESIRRQYI